MASFEKTEVDPEVLKRFYDWASECGLLEDSDEVLDVDELSLFDSTYETHEAQILSLTNEPIERWIPEAA